MRSSVFLITIVFVVSTSVDARAQDATAGDVTVAYGVNYSDRSTDEAQTLNRTTVFPLAAAVYLDPRVVVHIGIGAPSSVRVAGADRAVGVGDTKIGLSRTLPDTGDVEFTLDYTIKLPTADSGKNLGSGFADHQFTITPKYGLGDYSASADFGLNIVGTSQAHDSYFFTNAYFDWSDPNYTREFNSEVDYTPAAAGNPSDAVLILGTKIQVADREAARSQKWYVSAGLSAGLVSSSSRWGAFATVTYVNAHPNQTLNRALRTIRPPFGRHILGLGVTGSHR